MPYVKFDTPSMANKATPAGFVAYMEKEDKLKGIDKEFWFNECDNYIPSHRIMEDIENQKGLGKNDTRYYTGSISFSEEELAFLNNDTKKLKQFGKAFIEEYANNFNKGLSARDVRFYLKLETDRYYKGTDLDVASGNKRTGMKKPGCNTHFHFIIGRKSWDEKKKLSPQSNHINTKTGAVKGGFSRDELKKRTEYLFDTMFKYNRPLEQTYQHYKSNCSRQDLKSRVKEKVLLADKTTSSLRYDYLTLEEKEKKLNVLVNYMQHGINKNNANPISIDAKSILDEAHKRNYNGDVYKALLNMNYRLKNGFKPTGDVTPYILEYAKFTGAPYSKLPQSMKEDRFMRFVQIINKQLPKDDRLDSIKLFEIEKQNHLNGKVYRALGEFNKLLSNEGAPKGAQTVILESLREKHTTPNLSSEENAKHHDTNIGNAISSVLKEFSLGNLNVGSSSDMEKPIKKKKRKPRRRF